MIASRTVSSSPSALRSRLIKCAWASLSSFGAAKALGTVSAATIPAAVVRPRTLVKFRFRDALGGPDGLSTFTTTLPKCEASRACGSSASGCAVATKRSSTLRLSTTYFRLHQHHKYTKFVPMYLSEQQPKHNKKRSCSATLRERLWEPTLLGRGLYRILKTLLRHL